jgi:hypothetical protein
MQPVQVEKFMPQITKIINPFNSIKSVTKYKKALICQQKEQMDKDNIQMLTSKIIDSRKNCTEKIQAYFRKYCVRKLYKQVLHLEKRFYMIPLSEHPSKNLEIEIKCNDTCNTMKFKCKYCKLRKAYFAYLPKSHFIPNVHCKKVLANVCIDGKNIVECMYPILFDNREGKYYNIIDLLRFERRTDDHKFDGMHLPSNFLRRRLYSDGAPYEKIKAEIQHKVMLSPQTMPLERRKQPSNKRIENGRIAQTS